MENIKSFNICCPKMFSVAPAEREKHTRTIVTKFICSEWFNVYPREKLPYQVSYTLY